MLTYFTPETTGFGQRGIDNAEAGALLVAVWLRPDGDIDLMTNTDQVTAARVLTAAVLQAAYQDLGNAH